METTWLHIGSPMSRNNNSNTEALQVVAEEGEDVVEADLHVDAVAAVTLARHAQVVNDVVQAAEVLMIVQWVEAVDVVEEEAGEVVVEEEETRVNQDGLLTSSGQQEREEMWWLTILTGHLLKSRSGLVKNGNRLMLMRKMNYKRKLRR